MRLTLGLAIFVYLFVFAWVLFGGAALGSIIIAALAVAAVVVLDGRTRLGGALPAREMLTRVTPRRQLPAPLTRPKLWPGRASLTFLTSVRLPALGSPEKPRQVRRKISRVPAGQAPVPMDEEIPAIFSR